jgi:hypothetical protein
MALDGPDVYCTLKIPAGQFYLSLYDFNKRGHEGDNRFRDYRVSVRAHAPNLNLDSIDDFGRQPELATGRIHDFWGGVWKRYFVQGPMDLTIQVRRNGSMNTILGGVMVDLVDERPAPYFKTVEQWRTEMGNLREIRTFLLAEPAAERSKRFKPRPDLASAAESLFNELENSRLRNAPWWSAESRPYYAALARFFQTGAARESGGAIGSTHAAKPVDPRIATCYYRLGLFDRWEHQQRAGGLMPARDVERALRWNEISTTDEGRGYQIVAKFVASRGAADAPPIRPKTVPQALPSRAVPADH